MTELSPYTPENEDEEPDASETRLIAVAAARRVITRDGVEHMTLESVAQEAGLNMDELVEQFANTHELLVAMGADDLVTAHRGMSTGSLPGDTPAEGIAQLLERVQVLERALAELTERYEQSVRERSNVVAWVEQCVNTLRQRVESSEQHNAQMIAELKTALATATANAAQTKPVEESAPVIPPPPSAVSEPPPLPAFPPIESSLEPHHPPAESYDPPASPVVVGANRARDPSPARTKPEPTMEAYLSNARKAAINAQSGHQQETQARTKRNAKRAKVLIGACLGFTVIALTGTMVLNRNVVTATPAATAPTPVATAPAPAANVPAPAATPAPAAPAPAVEKEARAPLSPPPEVTVGQPNDPTPAQLNSTMSADKLAELAKSGDAGAERDLGLKYLAGDGVTVSESEAARWLMRAAYKGEPTAEYWLGTLYARGHGVPADAFQANHWYEAAAKQGNRRAMHSYAVAHFQGLGVEKNFAEAARWFRSAADLGYVDSQFNLAVLFERGAGVEQSLTEAYKWYAIAAKAGDKEADARVAALATQLEPADLALAQQAATSFKPEPMNQSANVATGTPAASGG